MNIPKKEVLYARLADDVNKKLNPDEFHFSEFYFNEMVDMFKLPGMDQWPKTLETSLNKFLFSLVSFYSPNRKVSSKLSPSTRHEKAHQLSLGMLHHCFPEKKDRSSITTAMDNFPSLAIFMAPLVSSKQKKINQKPRKTKITSIFDHESTSYLAVLNYFREEKQTQVLWLATTLLEPPEESIHVTWRNKGLATYLLSILVKQHTGIGDGSLENSLISLQASMD